MSTVSVTNLKNASSASNNLVLDASGNTTAAGTVAMGSSYLRNRIINGDMRIDQRNAGASLTPTTNGQYMLDRWRANISLASKFSVQQNAGSVTPPAGFSNYMGFTSLSAYSVGASETFGFIQGIEGFNTADLGWGTANAQTITISFWARSSLTGTFGGALSNNAQNRSYPFSFSVSAANTWEYKTVTISGDTSGTWATDNSVGVWLRFSLGTGSTLSGAAGSWSTSNLFSATGATSVVGTNGATFYITGVQLEVGTVATPFERRLYGTELMLCQRYYWRGGNGASGVQATSTIARFNVQFPVVMRAAPTVSAIAAPQSLNPTVAESNTGSQTTDFLATASGGLITDYAASKIQFGGFSSFADGRPCTLLNTCLQFSAEL